MKSRIETCTVQSFLKDPLFAMVFIPNLYVHSKSTDCEILWFKADLQCYYDPGISCLTFTIAKGILLIDPGESTHILSKRI